MELFQAIYLGGHEPGEMKTGVYAMDSNLFDITNNHRTHGFLTIAYIMRINHTPPTQFGPEHVPARPHPERITPVLPS